MIPKQEINIEDGCWRVASFDKRHTIQHRCDKNHWTEDWIDRVYHPDNRGGPCPWCKELAPEGLQVSFMFLKMQEYLEVRK